MGVKTEVLEEYGRVGDVCELEEECDRAVEVMAVKDALNHGREMKDGKFKLLGGEMVRTLRKCMDISALTSRTSSSQSCLMAFKRAITANVTLRDQAVSERGPSSSSSSASSRTWLARSGMRDERGRGRS